MTDHYAGAAEQLARDLARVKDERDRLRTRCAALSAALRDMARRVAYRDALAAENADLRAQLDEARTAIRVLTGMARPGDRP